MLSYYLNCAVAVVIERINADGTKVPTSGKNLVMIESIPVALEFHNRSVTIQVPGLKVTIYMNLWPNLKFKKEYNVRVHPCIILLHLLGFINLLQSHSLKN